MLEFKAGFNCCQNRAIQSVQFISKIPRQILLLFLIFVLAILAFGGYVYWQNKQILPQAKTLWTKELPQEIRENLKIDRKISTGETSIASQKTGYTKSVEVVITNASDKPLKNVRFVERIPKEIAKSIEELTFNIQPTAILNKDVEVVWEFGEIKPKGGIKIVYETWQKVTDPAQGEPKIDELVKAVVETMAEEKPKAEIPEQSKDYTSIASLLKKVAIEKKEGEVVDKEFLVHGVIIQPYKIPPYMQLLGSLFVKAVQLALDAFMPDEVLPPPVKDKLGSFKDAGIESAYNFVTKELHLILGDLPLESEVEIDGAKVPPIFTLYNWPLAKTPELEPGHVFSGKVKLVKLLNGTFHLQILPGFGYDDPLGYVSLYDLSPKLSEYKGKEVTTIGRVSAVEEKEGNLWVKVTLDGYRQPSDKEKNIFGYSLWATLAKDSSTPKKSSVLTLSGIIKEAKFSLPIEDKDDNRLYLAVGETINEQVATSLPKARIVENKKVYLGDKLLLDIKDYEPGYSGFYKIDYSSANDYFYVLLGCFENDDRLFLFKADGSDKKEITGKWDVANNGIVDWDPDGKSFVYHRINSCCVEPERFGEKGPPVGMVRYVVATGEKTVIGPYKPKATSTPAPKGSAVPVNMTAGQFLKLPPIQGDQNLGACFNEVRPIIMELEIIKEIQERWDKDSDALQDTVTADICSARSYEGKDSTGTVKLCIMRYQTGKPYDRYVQPTRKLVVGRKYRLLGCRPYLGTGGPGLEPMDTFAVRDDWENAIVEK